MIYEFFFKIFVKTRATLFLVKRLYFILYAIFSLFIVSAQEQNPVISNYGGRRVFVETEKKFSLIGVKVQESESRKNFLNITLYFNDIIDSASVSAKNIFYNDRPIWKETKFYFSKKGQSVSFELKKGEESSSIRFEQIKNLDGQIIRPVRLTDFAKENFWKYSKEEHIWQKS